MSTADSSASLNSHVAGFRRFNRMYTRFIGVLDEEFLKTVSARFLEMRKDFKESYNRYNY